MSTEAPISRTADPRLPRHIAIIMDGNGRWAASHGLPRIKGHEEGSKSAADCVEACGDAGVPFLTLYAFSAENWKRPKAEVAALMALLERFLKEKTREMHERNVRLLAIGRLGDLPRNCRLALDRAIETTRNNSALTLVLALSYGGRQEIIDAVRTLAREVKTGRLEPDAIDEDAFTRSLYTGGIPDPDLLVRTSGENRLSNFLLWQLSYTEIYITQKLWPDFRKADLLEAIADYGRRNRRFGAV